MALLAGRAQLALARQGRQLLEEKRDALLREFHRDVRLIYASHDELEAAAAAARLSLDEARVRHGPLPVAAAAAAASGDIAIEVRAQTVMGVAVPTIEPRELERRTGARGLALEATGPALELAAERFERELSVAIRVASMEVRARRLAREIRRTSSRVSALRTRVIPDLETETLRIAFALEQREREDRFRLKRVKAIRASKRRSPADRFGRAESVPGREG
jgi:V/A-type H+-transporting ATPase subunit D